MPTLKYVAVAGASGSLGKALVKELLAANFEITALTRSDSSSTFPEGVKVARVDYDNVESLTSALRGQDALISALGLGSLNDQEKMVDAAVAAGIKRLIPSEFGFDMDIPKDRESPAAAGKKKTQDEILRKTRGTKTTYTFVYNNVFLDWGIEHQFLVDLKGKKMQISDGGDTTFSAAPLQLIGKATVGVLQHPEETANRAVRVHGTAITQNKLLEIAKRVVGKDGWETTHSTTRELENKGHELLKSDPGNVFGWILPFLFAAVYGKDYGCDLSSNNDNELLGVEALSEKEVEDVVRAHA